MNTHDDFVATVKHYADRLGNADVDVLGALFDLTSQRLVGLAIAVTRNQHDAEDAVQTTLVRVANRPAVLAAAKSPWAYLLQMVRNEALVIGRRRKRWVAVESLVDLVVDCKVDELEREETHRAIWSALRTLPVEQAEVVVLMIWEQMTFAEIGQLLETPPGTVASRYQYGMAKLAQRLSAQSEKVRRD